MKSIYQIMSADRRYQILSCTLRERGLIPTRENNHINSNWSFQLSINGGVGVMNLVWILLLFDCAVLI